MKQQHLYVTLDIEEAVNTDLIMTRKVGQGKYDVFHVQAPNIGKEFAAKIFPKSEKHEVCYHREKSFLETFNHPNIIKLYPVTTHEDAEFDLLVMEYADHGDFFEIVKKVGFPHEVYVRTYFHQLISGLEYLHSRGTAHLDLKPENLLLDKNFQLKIIDFEQSQTQVEQQLTARGTHSYRSPELKNQTCTDKFSADIYSAGIILFVFKARQFPFIETDKEGEPKFLNYDLFIKGSEEFWKSKAEKIGEKSDFFSKDLRALLKGMLDADPNKRFTLEDVKKSEWFNKPIFSPESLAQKMQEHLYQINPSSPMSPKTKAKKAKTTMMNKFFKIFGKKSHMCYRN